MALPELEGTGGIQTLGRLLIGALTDDFYLTVLSLNDNDLSTDMNRASVRGFARNKFSFSVECVRRARNSDLVFFGHPNLAALILFLGRARSTVLLYGIDAWAQSGRMNIAGLKRASSLIAISDYTLRRTLSTLDLKPQAANVLHPALDPRRGGEPSVRVPEPQRLLTVTRLDPADRYKGVDAILRVIPRLIGDFPRLRLRIVGSGVDLRYYESLIRDLQIEPYVNLLGFVSDAQLRDEYAKAHLFVLPSSSEGFGLVYLEAMSWALPVIASAEGAAPEALEGGKSGVLVAQGDLDQLEAGLRRLLTDDRAAAELGERGRRWVESSFTFEDFKTRTVHLLNQLIQEG